MRDFKTISSNFLSNIQALRIFAHEFGLKADELDKSMMEVVTEAIYSLAPSLKALHADHSDSAQTPSDAIVDKDARQSQLAKEINDNLKNPEIIKKIQDAVRSAGRFPPKQGLILRRSTLVILVSFLEGLISDLLAYFYSSFPEALPSSERVLSLADLKALGSVKDAEQFLVSKEIDSVLRGSLEEQLSYMSKRPSLNLKCLEPIIPAISEVVQRRNLFVHNDGIVNRVYLDKLDSAIKERFSPKEGSPLETGSAYINEAIDHVFLTCVMMIQCAWRKWCKPEISPADDSIIDIVYETLHAGRFHLVILLTDFSSQLKFEKDVAKKVLVINRAIAFRRLGQHENVRKTLEMCDWSSCSLRFQVALSILQGLDNVYDLIRRAFKADDISLENLTSWPLFEDLRSTKDFQSLLQELKGQHF